MCNIDITHEKIHRQEHLKFHILVPRIYFQLFMATSTWQFPLLWYSNTTDFLLLHYLYSPPGRKRTFKISHHCTCFIFVFNCFDISTPLTFFFIITHIERIHQNEEHLKFHIFVFNCLYVTSTWQFPLLRYCNTTATLLLHYSLWKNPPTGNRPWGSHICRHLCEWCKSRICVTFCQCPRPRWTATWARQLVAAEWNCRLNEICTVYITFHYESIVRDISEAQHIHDILEYETNL